MEMRPAVKAVYDHWMESWGVTSLTVYGNESHPQPEVTPWVRVSFRENRSGQQTVGGPGNKIFERRGSVYVQIFVRANEGEGLLLELTQKARNVFEGKSISVAGERINFLGVDVERGKDEPYLISMLVEAQCRYQERK